MPPSLPDVSVAGDPEFANLLDELTAQLQAQQDIDMDDYLARFPQYSDRLEQLLPAMHTLVKLASAAGDGEGAEDDSPQERASLPVGTIGGRLGDFRIVREIGRGGMGVVYEAEQISLRRRVALKVLPLAGILDDQILKRFKNEALAAATLDHPNIVGVFFVGSDRGVHYYAMKLIEGQTLAELIVQLQNAANDVSCLDKTTLADDAVIPFEQRSETTKGTATVETARWPHVSPLVGESQRRRHYRRGAELGIQAARALAHAHVNGILHRDIKPGNLLVDGQGKLWVADFGLARIECEASVTRTGDVLGTLRYMSPEAAAGGSHGAIVDQRADIYSLGVTLYELLTLRPAFDGRDRKALLHAIIFDEPQSPRHISPGVPVDLETILLKAMRKDPADRYRTADDLAEDLDRFLRHQPIMARRPSTFEKLRMWSRRNQTTTIAGVIVLLVVTLALAASTLFISRAYRTEVASRKRAEASEEAAVRQRQLTEQSLGLALEAFEQLRLLWQYNTGRYYGDSDSQIGYRSAIGREFARHISQLYEQLAQHEVTNDQLRLQLANAALRVADISAGEDKGHQAERAYQYAIRQFEVMVNASSTEDDLVSRLAAARVYYASLLSDFGRTDEATKNLDLARSQASLLADLDPSAYEMLIQLSFQMGRNDDAETLLRKWEAHFDRDGTRPTEDMLSDGRERKFLTRVHDMGQFHRASVFRSQRQYDLALQDCNAIASVAPRDAFAYLERGHIHRFLGKFEDAYRDFDQAIQLSTDTLASWLFYFHRANTHFVLGRFAEGIDDLNESVHLVGGRSVKPKAELAWQLAHGPLSSLRVPQRAIELARDAYYAVPSGGMYRDVHGMAHDNPIRIERTWLLFVPYSSTLALAYYRAGRYEDCHQLLVSTGPMASDVIGQLVLTLALEEMGAPDAAATWLQRATAGNHEKWLRYADVVRLLAECRVIRQPGAN